MPVGSTGRSLRQCHANNRGARYPRRRDPRRSTGSASWLQQARTPEGTHRVTANTPPPIVFVALDGPRDGHPTDRERVDDCKRAVDAIDWTTDVRTRYLSTNSGLELAIPDALTWALESQESIVVIEDDVVVGPDLLKFTGRCLELYRDRPDISHVSGYNVVPIDELSHPDAPARLSLFPESFAWATWKRAWEHYDPELSWALQADIGELRAVLGTTAAALRWKEIFADAEHRRISTWAYRWIGSIWANGATCVSPNENLITYTGYTDGTHTRRKARWSEQPIGTPSIDDLSHNIVIDPLAERYVLERVFRGTPAGVAVGAVESLALGLLRYQRRRRSG